MPNTPAAENTSPHPALKLRHTLRGHTGAVYRMALSPDGRILASPSEDKTVRLWDIEYGRLLRTLEHGSFVICVAWSSDGKTLATGDFHQPHNVLLWDFATGQKLRLLQGHNDYIKDIAWSPNGKLLASCSNDNTARLWDTVSGGTRWRLKGHPEPYQIESVAWSPNGTELCTTWWGNTISLWDMKTGIKARKLNGYNGDVISVAWSPDGKQIASGSKDRTIRIWNPNTGRVQYMLEGHTTWVVFVSFLDRGRLLASLGIGGEVIFWRTDTWSEVLHVIQIGDASILSNLAVHPTLPLIATRGADSKEINLWNLDLSLLYGAEPPAPTIFYVNAKAVLLGDSGVGKSGLGIRIAEDKFRETQSTHGAQFWHFPTEQLPTLPPNIQGELTLWDLAGQPEYRLTHQLFLDDTDAALLLFDCSDANDPFRGVPYWAKTLKKHAPPHAKKYLVSARCDVSPVTVDDRTINQMLAAYDLDAYIKTSAHTGEGVAETFQRLMREIPWEELPRTSTPELFQATRKFLLEQKATGNNLIEMSALRTAMAQRYSGRNATQAELDTIVQLLQNRGLVYRLDPRPGNAWVLLKPERINQYGASIIQAARNHPHGIGAVAERDALTGAIPITGFERLPPSDEALVLEGTVELLIRRDLGFREMGYLVFPSQINETRPPEESHPRTEVAYRFSGGIESIYASLVVRLGYTDYFRREDQWKYAVEFSRDGQRLGFAMRQIEEGTGELEIYFQPGVNEFDRVTFIRFVTDHLRAKGIDIEEQIRLYCPNCDTEVENRAAIQTRIERGKLEIPCQFCDTAIVIPRSVEEFYRKHPSLSAKQQQLTHTVERRTQAEVAQLRADRQYLEGQERLIHILHLSDLHFSEQTPPKVWLNQLETDLKQELNIRRLAYLVISGDVADRSTETEYRAAFEMVDSLVKRFGLVPERVVVVPGNHDLNWDLSEDAYPFVPTRKLRADLAADRHIPAGAAGALVRDDARYQQRFALFNEYFYRRVYPGQAYPLDYAKQFVCLERPEDRILFLGLNSCWQVDHHFSERAGIHPEALAAALERVQDGQYEGWLKLAVWHHPVAGKHMMDDAFLQQLAVHKFQVCLHGHIHEAAEGFYRYDDSRNMHIIGAGTFGARPAEQVTGIPLQYNLLSFDPETGRMTVKTRKKEKAEGAWAADARWGDKNTPQPEYDFEVAGYRKQ